MRVELMRCVSSVVAKIGTDDTDDAETTQMSPLPTYPHRELTGEIIGAFFKVYNYFGYGFLESGYRRALAVEMKRRGLEVDEEMSLQMIYEDVVVGTYRADLVVNRSIIVETKAGLNLDPSTMVQVLNYLRIMKLDIGLVLHFGPRPSIKRLIASRSRLEDITPR
jgi:GxxExxY protein